MFLGMLRGQAPRPFFAPDDGTGSGSPAADPAPTPTPAADPAPGSTAGAGTPPADPPADPPAPAADEPADEDEDADPELTNDEWQAEAQKARKQAARYRTQLRTAEAEIARLSAVQQPAAPDPAQAAEQRATAAERRAIMAEAAAEIGVASGMLRAIAAIQVAETPEQIQAALTQLHSFQAPASAGTHRPPNEPTQAPTLAQQIQAAEAAHDVKLSMRLKSQQLAQLAAQQTR